MADTFPADPDVLGLWRCNEGSASEDAIDSGPYGLDCAKSYNPPADGGARGPFHGYGGGIPKFIRNNADVRTYLEPSAVTIGAVIKSTSSSYNAEDCVIAQKELSSGAGTYRLFFRGSGPTGAPCVIFSVYTGGYQTLYYVWANWTAFYNAGFQYPIGRYASGYMILGGLTGGSFWPTANDYYKSGLPALVYGTQIFRIGGEPSAESGGSWGGSYFKLHDCAVYGSYKSDGWVDWFSGEGAGGGGGAYPGPSLGFTVAEDGGHELLIPGTFPTNTPLEIRIGLEGSSEDALCYGGRGYGYLPESQDGATVRILTPPLPVDPRNIVTWCEVAGTPAVIGHITVLERNWAQKQHSSRICFPGWAGVGKRRLDIEEER